jgi:hypothetical protein
MSEIKDKEKKHKVIDLTENVEDDPTVSKETDVKKWHEDNRWKGQEWLFTHRPAYPRHTLNRASKDKYAPFRLGILTRHNPGDHKRIFEDMERMIASELPKDLAIVVFQPPWITQLYHNQQGITDDLKVVLKDPKWIERFRRNVEDWITYYKSGRRRRKTQAEIDDRTETGFLDKNKKVHPHRPVEQEDYFVNAWKTAITYPPAYKTKDFFNCRAVMALVNNKPVEPFMFIANFDFLFTGTKDLFDYALNMQGVDYAFLQKGWYQRNPPPLTAEKRPTRAEMAIRFMKAVIRYHLQNSATDPQKRQLYDIMYRGEMSVFCDYDYWDDKTRRDWEQMEAWDGKTNPEAFYEKYLALYSVGDPVPHFNLNIWYMRWRNYNAAQVFKGLDPTIRMASLHYGRIKPFMFRHGWNEQAVLGFPSAIQERLQEHGFERYLPAFEAIMHLIIRIHRKYFPNDIDVIQPGELNDAYVGWGTECLDHMNRIDKIVQEEDADIKTITSVLLIDRVNDLEGKEFKYQRNALRDLRDEMPPSYEDYHTHRETKFQDVKNVCTRWIESKADDTNIYDHTDTREWPNILVLLSWIIRNARFPTVPDFGITNDSLLLKEAVDYIKLNHPSRTKIWTRRIFKSPKTERNPEGVTLPVSMQDYILPYFSAKFRQTTASLY